ncbi:molybdate ABC transporter substrate-binding protein [Streptomyces subrutilus]|uniref:ABC transporter substrate-binding protein n=1 Tax=Streptomyces subrutilus TaxID=36818 RepID=A0A5P2UW58_9ACTN|nr:substrate-binding domain-containing protein [Streptomyces subrutilus]QEU82579.1 ABC transporter substrate-binding protein [Streptomyces subrutilus]WSJ27941.1 substrate-binding domain-containing protein [Streptomyces subrutilus]GGZ82267.1 molybdate ABC transporter substrate-binding protein [Streptomyces subrutilus]
MSAEKPHTVSLFSALAVKKALDDVILTAFTEQTGTEVDGIYDPTNVLLRRIEEGARPDVMIGVTGAFPALCDAGVIDRASVRDIARVGIGLAVPPGARPPAIDTVDALVTALRSARSVAYSRTGASGVHFAALLDRLGIADEVNARATVVEKGFTALAVTDGRADLAVQQMSELLFVPEARVAGPLPDGAQHFTELSAALGTAAVAHAGARALHAFLTGKEAGDAYRRAGLEALPRN